MLQAVLAFISAFLFIISAAYWHRASKLELYTIAILGMGGAWPLTKEVKLQALCFWQELPGKSNVNLRFTLSGYLNAVAAQFAAGYLLIPQYKRPEYPRPGLVVI